MNGFSTPVLALTFGLLWLACYAFARALASERGR